MFCLLDADLWSGLWPAIFSSIVVVVGYWLQAKQFRKQSKKQQEDLKAQIDIQQKISRDELSLSIKQTLLDISLKKAQDCNACGDFEINLYGQPNPANNRFYDKTISEMVISVELLNQSFRLMRFGISETDKNGFIYIYWKQLSTAVPSIFCNHAFEQAIREHNKGVDVKTYSYQIMGIYEFCIQISVDMENAPTKKYNELKALIGL